MAKLVDREKLAKLAKALDQRAQDFVAEERERAVAVEAAIEAKANANAAAIAEINNEENGLLAQAKAHADEAVADAKQEAQDANDVLEGRIASLEGLVVGGEGEGLEAIIGDVAANKAAINKLNGGAEEEGSVAKAVADAIAPVQEDLDEAAAKLVAVDAKDAEQDGKIAANEAAAKKAQEEVDAVELRMNAAEAALEKLTGEGDESVAKMIADAVDPVDAKVVAMEANIGKAAEGDVAATGLHKVIADADAKALQDAKAYADQQIAALVDSAPDALNTLNELAEAIELHQDEFEGYVAVVGNKVDKVEGSRLISEVEAAGYAAKAEVAAVEQALEDAKEYADGKATELQAAIDACEEKDVVQDNRIAALEGLVVGGEGEGLEAIIGDVAKAKAAADAAQADVNALEERMVAVEAKDQEHNGKIAANEAAAKAAQDAADAAQADVDDVAAEVEAIKAADVTRDGKIAANEAAIAKLNGGVEEEGSVAKALADALADYSTTEAMTAILGNVVNSLALVMENDKMVLKLGGVEGVAITEVEFDVATDADIDDIISGLDAE